MVWSLLIMALILLFMGRLRAIIPLLRKASVVATFSLSSAMLALNWLIYIWAVNSGHIVEASLGYFINPLVTVALGVFVLKERLRGGQRIALVSAAAGVAYLTFIYGRFPLIALILAASFAIYGLIHKKTKIGAPDALFIETMMLFIPAAAFLLWVEQKGMGSFVHGGLTISTLLAGAGVATTLPLLLFTFAARNIPLSLLGVLQYTTPTMNLLLGIFLYHEEFPVTRMIGFLFVWSGLAIYLIEGLFRRRGLDTIVQKKSG